MASGQIPRKQVNITLSEGTSYGTANVPALSNSDTMESAFSKLTSILDKLAPQTPPTLDQLTLTRSLSGITEDNGTANDLSGSSVDNVYKFSNGATITWTTTGEPVDVDGTRNGYFGDVSDTDGAIRFRHTKNGGSLTTDTLNLSSIGEIIDAGSITNGSGTFSFTTTSTLEAGDGLRITLDDNSTVTRTVNTFTPGSPNTVVGSSDVTGTISKIQVITAERADSYAKFNLLDAIDFWSASNSASTYSNFYEAMKFSLTAELTTTTNDADTDERNMYLEYSASGTFSGDILTPITSISYYIEDEATPTASINSLTYNPGTMTEYVSGILSAASGETVEVDATLSNCIKNFYPDTVGSSTLTGTGAVNETLSGVQVSGNYNYVKNHTFTTGQYSDTITAIVTPYDVFASGTTDTDTLAGIRVDTSSITRRDTDATTRILWPTTSTGQYNDPTSAGFYDVAEHTNSLSNTSSTVYGNALQLLNGKYQYPANTDYTIYGGPSYLSAGANFGLTRPTRWATFKFTETVSLSGSSAQYLRMNFTNTSSFTQALRQAGSLQVYYKLKYTSGGTKETLWLDTKYAVNPGAFSAGAPYMTTSGNPSPYGGTVGTGTLDSTKTNDNDIYATVGASIPDTTSVDVYVMVGIAYNLGTTFVLPEANITFV